MCPNTRCCSLLLVYVYMVYLGGVVIGALTAGVGLVPYLGLVGAAAAVGGGAVAYTASQSPSSRVILAAETEVDR